MISSVIIWLVVYLPLWKIWKSVGMIILNGKIKKYSKPPTSYPVHVAVYLEPFCPDRTIIYTWETKKEWWFREISPLNMNNNLIRYFTDKARDLTWLWKNGEPPPPSDVYWFTNHVSPLDMIYPPESGISLATNKPTCVSREFFLQGCDPLTVPRGAGSPLWVNMASLKYHAFQLDFAGWGHMFPSSKQIGNNHSKRVKPICYNVANPMP